MKIKDKQVLPEQLAIEPKQHEFKYVSKLIADYIQDLTNRSFAGYSIRYDSENKTTNIGNKVIEFDNNNIKIADKIYNATGGLMELLLKKTPNFSIITDVDKQSYKQILDDSDAIYQKFDSTQNKLNTDRSHKWKFISEELYGSDD